MPEPELLFMHIFIEVGKCRVSLSHSRIFISLKKIFLNIHTEEENRKQWNVHMHGNPVQWIKMRFFRLHATLNSSCNFEWVCRGFCELNICAQLSLRFFSYSSHDNGIAHLCQIHSHGKHTYWWSIDRFRLAGCRLDYVTTAP